MSADLDIKLDGNIISHHHEDLAIQVFRGIGIGFMLCGLITETITLLVIYKDQLIANRLYIIEANNSCLNIIAIFMTIIYVIANKPILELLYLIHFCPLVLLVTCHMYINYFSGLCTILMEKVVFYCTLFLAVFFGIISPFYFYDYGYNLTVMINTFSFFCIIFIISTWSSWIVYYYVRQPGDVSPADFHLLNVPLFVAASWFSFVGNLMTIHVDHRSFVWLIFINPLIRFTWHMYSVQTFKDSVMNLFRMNRSRIQMRGPDFAAAWSGVAGVQLQLNYPQPPNEIQEQNRQNDDLD